MPNDTYADDVAFLGQHTPLVELADGEARVAVAPAYQGRAMTSTLAGPEGASFGWVHRTFVAAGSDEPVFNNYGGEDRFWLGPEAGQFGLWFAPGEPFDLAHWKTPPGFNAGRFGVTSQGAASVVLATEFAVTSRAGTRFDCAVRREIGLLDAPAAEKLLGAPIPPALRSVGFQSRNTLTNTSKTPWTRDRGLLSVWILGQFKPLPRGRVLVPLRPGPDDELGPPATTDYFGPLPPERCAVGDDLLRFACDGQYRSKIGISPRRARSALGSYDPDAKVLTIVAFNLPPRAAELPYVNSLWQMQDDPYAGDVVNSYNDGEPAAGAGQLGPFYEIETSSPAAELAPGEAITHVHGTFHFAGPDAALAELARKVLGADLAAAG